MVKGHGLGRHLVWIAAVTMMTGAAQTPSGSAAQVNPRAWPAPASPFKADAALEQRVAGLLAKMTLEEKVGQVIQPDIGSVTPEDMRRGYEDWTERARQFLHDKGLVSFPAGEECAVVPSPPFQRPVLAVASYVSPPSFAETMRGHFFVPYPPDGASEAPSAELLVLGV